MKKPGIPRKKSLASVLIKPAGPDCNMACSYCFYREKEALYPGAPVHRMSEAVLEETMRQIFAQPIPAVSIGWQGGEPTLMGLPFFRKAVDLQTRFGQGKSAGNGLQTNGLLLDRAWADFLKEYRFLVGLSLDGPEHVHDHYRRLSGGQGTWAKIVDAAKLLLDTDTAVNALVVVNEYSARFPREIYEFHKALGLNHMQFIPCVETDPRDGNLAAPFSVSAEAIGEFLTAIFDLWRADFKNGEPTTFIRYFDSVFFRYVDREPPECDLLAECGTYLVVEHNGDVYACDFFVEERWRLGNVMNGKLVHLLNSAKQTEFGRMKTRLPGPCAACEWLNYCRGGCPKDRLRDPRDAGLSHFCAGYKKFFAHADPHLKALAKAWKARQGAS
jgi:serine-type anaerobic sulfatase-maturating enzyme